MHGPASLRDVRDRVDRSGLVVGVSGEVVAAFGQPARIKLDRETVEGGERDRRGAHRGVEGLEILELQTPSSPEQQRQQREAPDRQLSLVR